MKVNVMLSYPQWMGAPLEGREEVSVRIQMTEDASGLLVADVELSGEEFVRLLATHSVIGEAHLPLPEQAANYGKSKVWRQVDLPDDIMQEAVRRAGTPSPLMEDYAKLMLVEPYVKYRWAKSRNGWKLIVWGWQEQQAVEDGEAR